VFASKKSLAEAKSDSNTELIVPGTEGEGMLKLERRGSFFQNVEQQLALNRRTSMSPQTR